MPLWVGSEPEQRESEPNDELAEATAVTTPVTVNGRLGKPGDVDLYRVTRQQGRISWRGRRGDRLQGETWCRCSSLDGKSWRRTTTSGRRAIRCWSIGRSGRRVLVHIADTNADGGWKHYRPRSAKCPW